MPGMVGDPVKLEEDEEKRSHRLRARRPAPGMKQKPEARSMNRLGSDMSAKHESAELDEEILRAVAVHREILIGKVKLGA